MRISQSMLLSFLRNACAPVGRRNLAQVRVCPRPDSRVYHSSFARGKAQIPRHLGPVVTARSAPYSFFCTAMSASAKGNGALPNEEASAVGTEAMRRKAQLIRQKLEELYPVLPETFLDHTDHFTLLVSVVLSAQTTDAKVNQVTPGLFRQGGTPDKMRKLGETKIRHLIQQVGLAPQKARSLVELSAAICDRFDGQVPDTFEGLESLRGVGHKTASVVMMLGFGKPAFPVDTHIHRLACRWGCGHSKSVPRTEATLKRWFPDPNSWGDLHVRILLFGREHCPARRHNMDECPVCSFAATEEARKMNGLYPTKFVASLSHEDPFSIREVTADSTEGIAGDCVKEEANVSSKTKSPRRPRKNSKALSLEEGYIPVATKSRARPRTVTKAEAVAVKMEPVRQDVEVLSTPPANSVVKSEVKAEKGKRKRASNLTSTSVTTTDEAQTKLKSSTPAKRVKNEILRQDVPVTSTADEEKGCKDDRPLRKSTRIRRPTTKAM